MWTDAFRANWSHSLVKREKSFCLSTVGKWIFIFDIKYIINIHFEVVSSVKTAAWCVFFLSQQSYKYCISIILVMVFLKVCQFDDCMSLVRKEQFSLWCPAHMHLAPGVYIQKALYSSMSDSVLGQLGWQGKNAKCKNNERIF